MDVLTVVKLELVSAERTDTKKGALKVAPMVVLMVFVSVVKLVSEWAVLWAGRKVFEMAALWVLDLAVQLDVLVEI